VAKAAWSVSALAAVTLAVAGCGGGSSHGPAHPRPAASAPAPPHAAPVHLAPSEITLPASATGPTTCTVYEAGYATQVIFESPDLDVRAECRAWTRFSPEEGYLWGYEPTSPTTEAVGSRRICYVINPHANSTASVVQETGFRTVSAVERANATSACASLLASGWIAQLPAPRHRRH
jgi:hypothetical protein